MGEAGKSREEDVKMEKKEVVVFMWGYLPGASPQRSPLIFPVGIRLPNSFHGDSWKDVCGGGCGFAMAISELGKLITWGSTEDMGQSYVTSGKHEETPEAFPLPTEAALIKAAAGWAHCVAVTEHGDVYTWGWKECVPFGKASDRQSAGLGKWHPAPDHCNLSSVTKSQLSARSSESRIGAEECKKRRRVSSAKQVLESSTPGDDELSAVPCIVTLSPGIRIATVAAGGRHSLALSDTGQVWGWGYGGEGQLGLGSRVRMVSSPHPVSIIEFSVSGQEKTPGDCRTSIRPDRQYGVPGSYVKAIACGGRHSAVVTDAGAVLTFGWGLYGQCGQGTTDDELSPTCVASLLGINIRGIAAGLWHTICFSAEGDVYAFGGNQFGQLGTGSDQAETLPRLLDAPSFEDKCTAAVSCGARHTAAITEDGKVFCWGWNKYGQLGLGDAIDRSIPSEVAMTCCIPRSVACGWWHTLVLAEVCA